jgi:DnaJ-class molecular chaperone
VRWLLPFAVMLIGCVASIPADDGTTADIACEAARMIVQARSAMPPAPKPAGDKCDNCDGTGKVRSGDGIEVFTCPICKGTGKQPASVLVRP